MRKIYTLLLMSLPLFALSKGKNDLDGNWREVKRMGTDKKSISYTDTVFFQFLPGNEYIWQKAQGFIYRGSYKVENGALDIGMRYFTIVEQKKNKLVLRDDVGTYEFEPYTPVSQMTPGKAPEKYSPVTSIGQMVGKWDKFKGTSANTQQQIDYTRAVKKIEIFSSPDNGKLGYIYAGRDSENAPSWYVVSFSNGTLYCDGKDKRQFKVLKAENNEFFVEENGFTYFLRRFK